MDIKEKFEDFIAQYPIFEYRLLDTDDIKVHGQSANRNVSAMAAPGPVPRQ